MEESIWAQPSEGQPEAPRAKEPKEAKRRFAFSIKEDGAIDFDSMRGKSRKELKEVLSSQAVLSQISPDAVEGAGIELPEITEENVRAALAGIAKANAFILSFVVPRFVKIKLDPDIVSESCTFTEKQLEELAPRGARIANKRLPAKYKQWQDEIMFVSMLLFYSNQMAATAIKAQIVRNVQKAKAAPAGKQPTQQLETVQFSQPKSPGDGGLTAEATA